MSSKELATVHDDIKHVLHVLAVAAAGGARSKPTIKQLNEIVSRLEGTERLLRSIKPSYFRASETWICDEDVRAILSSKDVASGRSKIAAVLAKAEG